MVIYYVHLASFLYSYMDKFLTTYIDQDWKIYSRIQMEIIIELVVFFVLFFIMWMPWLLYMKVLGMFTNGKYDKVNSQ
jgi:hypothetical protein